MPRKILTVDDSRSLRDMAFCTLKGAGFEALEAKDGPKALGGLATIRVDLTSTDGASRPIAVNA